MKKQQLNDLPETELQKSDTTLEEIQRKASGYKLSCKNEIVPSYNYEIDIFLCLANEIQELKEEVNKLKQK